MGPRRNYRLGFRTRALFVLALGLASCHSGPALAARPQAPDLDVASFLFRTQADYCDERTGAPQFRIIDSRDEDRIIRRTVSLLDQTITASRYRKKNETIFVESEDLENAWGRVVERQIYNDAIFLPLALPAGRRHVEAYTSHWVWGRCSWGCRQERTGQFSYRVEIRWDGRRARVRELYHDREHPPRFKRHYVYGPQGIERIRVRGRWLKPCPSDRTGVAGPSK